MAETILNPEVPDSKFVLKSKTIEANLILAALTELDPSVSAWVSSHPQTALLASLAMNVVLRHLSRDKIHYVAPKI